MRERVAPTPIIRAVTLATAHYTARRTSQYVHLARVYADMVQLSSVPLEIAEKLQSPRWWGMPSAQRQIGSWVWGDTSHPLLIEPLVDPAGADPLQCGQIADPRTATQPTHQIIERRQHLRRLPAPHLAGVFMQADIAVIVQPVLDPPVPAAKDQQARRIRHGRRQAGDPIRHLVRHLQPSRAGSLDFFW